MRTELFDFPLFLGSTLCHLRKKFFNYLVQENIC